MVAESGDEIMNEFTMPDEPWTVEELVDDLKGKAAAYLDAEPKPDPSLARIATALEQLVELHPQRQRQAEQALRKQLDNISGNLKRKQDAIEEAYQTLTRGDQDRTYSILRGETWRASDDNADAHSEQPPSVTPLGSLLNDTPQN